MQKRQLGTTNFFVNPIFSHAYGAAVEKSEVINTIRAAYELGYNFFDTTECYVVKMLPVQFPTMKKLSAKRRKMFVIKLLSPQNLASNIIRTEV